MSNCCSDRGSIKGIFLLLLFVAAAFVLISFGKPYYRYNALRSHTVDLLEMEGAHLDVIKFKIMADAKELHVPLDESNLNVTLKEPHHVVQVRATWSETVDFWGYYQKKLDFEINEEL